VGVGCVFVGGLVGGCGGFIVGGVFLGRGWVGGGACGGGCWGRVVFGGGVFWCGPEWGGVLTGGVGVWGGGGGEGQGMQNFPRGPRRATLPKKVRRKSGAAQCESSRTVCNRHAGSAGGNCVVSGRKKKAGRARITLDGIADRGEKTGKKWRCVEKKKK